jgi:hypothetical protein
MRRDFTVRADSREGLRLGTTGTVTRERS